MIKNPNQGFFGGDTVGGVKGAGQGYRARRGWAGS